MRSLLLLALVLAPSIPRPTGACSLVPLDDGPHTVDEAFANDAVPPSAVVASATVHTYQGDSSGCGTADCGRTGAAILMDVSATDDQAPADQIGYQFAIVGGTAPAGLELPAGAVRSAYGDVTLLFPATRQDFNFALEIRAVDLNGNLGPATVVVISPDPS